MDKMINRNLVIVPFAYKEGANSGANIEVKRKKTDSVTDIYLKNAVVATVSCKKNNPGGGCRFYYQHGC